MENNDSGFDNGGRDFTHDRVAQRGLRPWDKVTIFPLQGKKRQMVLNRASYLFKLKKHTSFCCESYFISMPSLQYDNAVFGMFLSESGKDCDKRYLFKSLGNIPFRLNGSFCYEAHLEQGDILDLDYNQIQLREESKILVENPFDNLPPQKIIVSDISVLLQGETGTGKSKMAEEIHRYSDRKGNFVQISPTSFCEGLVESELFGHVKGAFTGAFRHKSGSMDLACGGTLFIDEIDSLPLSMQVKLLLFLDTKKIRPVGGCRDRKMDVRLIFASGKRLCSMVANKKMRSDFYYRITSGYTVTLKPLRFEKKRIKMICDNYHQKTKSIMDGELMDYYMDCQWPGNIRQLVGHLEKKKIIYGKGKWKFDEMDAQLKDELLPMESENHRFSTIEQMKIQYACKTYHALDKKLKETAKVLNISCNTLRSFLKRKEMALRLN